MEFLTAPVIFALQELEQKRDNTLLEFINNGFENKNDLKTAIDIIFNTQGIQKAKELALFYANQAIKSLEILPESEYKNALIDLSLFIVQRKY
ncbi:MAG: hypothetical protein MZV70_76390 [Desulfobacterales bacterium]|nr:hypothetical protein [Desulfobacterales bacterium]